VTNHVGAIESERANLVRPGLRERQRLARQSAILKAAFDLITERGYEALTMESLAEWVGITRQTLYHHFSNKDEIVLKAILEMVNEGTELVLSAEPGKPPIMRLRCIMRQMLEIRFSPTRMRLSKVKLSLLPFKARPEYLVAFDRRFKALEDIVCQAQATKEIRTDIPSAIIVQMLLNLVADAQYEQLIAAGVVTPEEIVHSIFSSFFKGLMA
jgi:AcrR family transcriptional regulator